MQDANAATVGSSCARPGLQCHALSLVAGAAPSALKARAGVAFEPCGDSLNL